MGGQDKNWLLIKLKDQYADRDADIVDARPDSVISGKTIEDMND